MFPSFTAIPAIDLKEGKVVRLTRGAMDSATIYGVDPAAVARQFEADGASVLHIVDLDGAVAGAPRNLDSIRRIRAAVRCTIEASGGLRTMAAIGECVRAGADRFSIGSAAILDPALLTEACRAYPGRVIGSIDVRAGRLALRGWTETSELTIDDVVARFRTVEVAALIYTDIARDGTQVGVDAAATAEFARRCGLPVIASGGVATIEDLKSLSRFFGQGVVGAIVGRALYEGRLKVSEIMAEFGSST